MGPGTHRINGTPKYPELGVIVPILLPLHAGATKVEASTTSAIVDAFVTPLSPLKSAILPNPPPNYLHLTTGSPSFSTVTLLLASTLICSF